jgi:histidinol-phosphate phosphatase family protein
MTALPTTVVVPSVGRPSLVTVLDTLRGLAGPPPEAVVVVDDSGCSRVAQQLGLRTGPGVTVVESGGRGPAAARNLGWRSARTPWVTFLDDDVVPGPSWLADLAADLATAGDDVGGVQGQVWVPAAAGRRPTDWERGTAGLADALWITADMSYRRPALAAVGGFDERYIRAFREDADLALRVQDAGFRLVTGRRRTCHPVRPAGDWVSLRQQAGNADDALMRKVHGPRWPERAQAPRGRRRRHLLVTAAGAAALGLAAVGRRGWAGVAAAGWVAGTAEFAAARILAGPRHRDEVRRMVLTSIAIPPVAVWHTLRGLLTYRNAPPWRGLPDVVLFDRDGTLVEDVPYNGEPRLVRTMPTARAALDRLRARGVRLGVVTNQSGVGLGCLTLEQVDAVNRRVDELLGPFDTWQVCPHAPDDGCECRKPAPALVERACAELGTDPARCVVIGDIGRDVGAASAAGARGVLVPTSATRDDEIRAADAVDPDLLAAVKRVVEGSW